MYVYTSVKLQFTANTSFVLWLLFIQAIFHSTTAIFRLLQSLSVLLS